MPKNRVSLAMDLADAAEQVDDLPDAVDDGASDAVKQLAVLAEGAMKKEAPEGASGDLRDEVDTKFRRGGLTANVGSRKRADDGVLLATYVVEGTDPNSYDPDNPPPPLFDWAAAKLGDSSLGWAVSQSIAQDGHETLPNDFVDRSLDTWRSQVEDVAGEQVRDAMSQLMGGS